jgi:hypothetical protein
MFGTYHAPFEIEQEGIKISLTQEGDEYFYQRMCLDEREEKVLLAYNPTILINPVEPVNKPKTLSPYALIEFNKPLMVEPKASKSVFLTFPVELGVFVSSGGDAYEHVDVLTASMPKFTLYGDPRTGIVCRYWKSDIYPSLPDVAPLKQGVFELGVSNTCAEWVKVTKAVFNAYGMKIYYSSNLVYMKAEMEIVSESAARTDFYDTPWSGDMTKSVELYVAKKFPITTTRFLMEYGL